MYITVSQVKKVKGSYLQGQAWLLTRRRMAQEYYLKNAEMIEGYSVPEYKQALKPHAVNTDKGTTLTPSLRRQAKPFAVITVNALGFPVFS